METSKVTDAMGFVPKSYCRLCLIKSSCLINLYSLKSQEKTSYIEIIKLLGGILFNDTEDLFEICNDCKDKIVFCLEFQQCIRKSFQFLPKYQPKIDDRHEINVTTVKKHNKDSNDIIKQSITLSSTNSLGINKGEPKNDIQSNEKLHDDQIPMEIDDSDGDKNNINENNENTNGLMSVLQKLHKNRNKCPLCLKNINDEPDIADHFYSHYRESNLTPLIVNGKKIKTCNLCDKTLKYNVMVTHHRIHLKINPFTCDTDGCGKGFISAQYLSKHMNLHAGLKNYQCQTCGKTFGLQSSLKNHEETHVFDDVKCQICNKPYKNNVTLKIHMKRHRIGPRYKCELSKCNKNFYTSQDRDRHRLTHVGEKAHVCDVCDKSWYTAKELERHRKYHVKVRQHGCGQCLKTFVQRNQLRLHEMNHSGEKPHMCEYCSTSFITQNKLKRHQIKSCKAAKSATKKIDIF